MSKLQNLDQALPTAKLLPKLLPFKAPPKVASLLAKAEARIQQYGWVQGWGDSAVTARPSQPTATSTSSPASVSATP